MHIVDHGDDSSSVIVRRAEERDGGHCHGERTAARLVAYRQCPFDGVSLRLGDEMQSVDERREQLHQPGEGKVHLRGHPGASDDLDVVGRGLSEALVDQRRFPHTGDSSEN